jgi:hypothetical protein
MLAHVSGLPIEEVLVSVTSAGGGALLVVRLLVGRVRRRAAAQSAENA